MRNYEYEQKLNHINLKLDSYKNETFLLLETMKTQISKLLIYSKKCINFVHSITDSPKH